MAKSAAINKWLSIYIVTALALFACVIAFTFIYPINIIFIFTAVLNLALCVASFKNLLNYKALCLCSLIFTILFYISLFALEG